MFLDERLEKILEILENEKKVKVTDLAEKFNVSEVIIRKNLKRLEQEGKLKRTHGGAILLKELVHSSTLEERIINRTKQKEIVARKIIENIENGETIFFDITSINYIASEYLANSEKEITLITNMPSITTHFNKNSKVDIIMIGGEYNKKVGGNVGSEAINYIKRYNVDKAFIGSAGIDLEAEKVMNFELNDGNTKKEIMKISKKIFLVTEYKKLGILGGYILAAGFLPLVSVGLHQALTPIHTLLNDPTGPTKGVNYLLPILMMAGGGQVGAGIAIYIKTKNQRLKNMVRDSIPVGILGIGEPLMYAVTLPLGKPFITACLGSGIGGVLAVLFHLGTISQGVSGLFGLLIAVPGTWIYFIIAMLGAYAGGFILTYFFGIDNEKIEEMYGK